MHNVSYRNVEIDPAFFSVNTACNTKRWRPAMQRPEVFRCSCYPPNVLRFLASLGDYLYGSDENTVYVHQFMESEATVDGCRLFLLYFINGLLNCGLFLAEY